MGSVERSVCFVLLGDNVVFISCEYKERKMFRSVAGVITVKYTVVAGTERLFYTYVLLHCP